MTVRKLASGSWELRVYAGLDPVTRKKRWISRSIRGNEREARRAERALRVEVDAGRRQASQGTVGHLLEQWYAIASPEWGTRHAHAVRGLIDQRLLPTIGPMRLDKLGAVDLDRLYHAWRQETPPLAPSTISKYHAIIHCALKQGVEWDWLGRNAADRAKRPKQVEHTISPPSAGQLRQAIAALEGEPDLALFVRLAAASGARRGELCALRSQDFDLGAGTLTIQRSLSQIGRDVQVKDPKTRAGRRVITMDHRTLALVIAYMAQRQALAVLGGSALVANPYVFSYALDCSSPWQPDTITQRWGRLRKRHGLDGVRLHDLRHFTATDLLGSGVDVRTVAGRLGHAQPAVTLNVYSHFLPARDEAAAAILGARLDEEHPPPPDPRAE